MKKYYFFIGTIAELIKVFPIILEMNKRQLHYKIIFSGQNNIKESSLYRSISINGKEISLSSGKIKQSALSLFFWFFSTLFKSLKSLKNEFSNGDKKNTFLIVHGDTISTVMGALLGKRFGLKVCHVEAGLRSFNLFHPFPEEIDRIITSKFVNISFCPNEWAVNNLKKNKSIKVNTNSNTLVDSLNYALSQKIDSNLNYLFKEKFCFFVCHRQENVSNQNLLKTLIDEMIQVSKKMKCVFILHDITRIALEKFNLFEKIQKEKNILLVERLPYFELMSLLKKSEFMITDGGSNQEECYYLNIPTLVLRKHTERNEGIGENVVLGGNETKMIKAFIRDYKKYKSKFLQPKISPSKKIVNFLEDFNE